MLLWNVEATLRAEMQHRRHWAVSGHLNVEEEVLMKVRPQVAGHWNRDRANGR